ncbi:MAG: DNA mismatch repair protein MutS [Woeseia sp.]|nr:Smr/MutS family protein [Woeseia sp.]MBT8097339.1 Smr/MutS family protein [Woeseia sp.]NNE60171.1 DNA mismatch repair protein MutS [Woeseia sp.]NNL55046.1 DNA mismatch repair protein MutS [Woeseia sp.]
MTDENNDDANPEDDEALLFRRAVEGARPVRTDLVEIPKRRPPPRARFRREDEQAVLKESLDTDIHDLEASAGERLRFRRPEVGERSLRKLARGRYSVQAEIDLHGLNSAQAEAELSDFIQTSIQQGLRCVRVIHGKGLGSGLGGPVLKVRVNRWLRRWREILAFVSARQVDGGSGAVYVLLRRD